MLRFFWLIKVLPLYKGLKGLFMVLQSIQICHYQYHRLVLSQVESAAQFANKVPGFSSLNMEDKVELLKHAGFEIALVQVSL